MNILECIWKVLVYMLVVLVMKQPLSSPFSPDGNHESEEFCTRNGCKGL